jgi:hypothetical protein
MSTKKKPVDNPRHNVHASHELKPAKNLYSFSGLFCFAGQLKIFRSGFYFYNKLLKRPYRPSLNALSVLLILIFSAFSFSTVSAQDADSDGVLDGVDWCPTQGGIVNALGCPFPTVCDTIETAIISFDTFGLNPTIGYKTIYILADSVGLIADTSSAPQFINVMAGKYMVVAMNYIDDASLANFAIADTITEATANCLEWSVPLTYRICPAEVCGNGIDDDEDGGTDCADSDCPNPAANATSTGPVCVGDNLLLVEEGGDAVSWSWSGPNTFISTEQNPNIANALVLADGTYNVTITSINACTKVASIAVTVYAPPAITGVSSVNPTVCALGDGTITVSASAGTGGIEYRVNGGAWQPTGAFTGLASGSHTVEIRNDNGFCIVAHSSTVTLSDPASPTAEITVPAIVCQSETASFTATDAGLGAIYTWDFGTGATPTTATGIGPHNVVYASSGSKAISLEVTSAIGCIGTDAEAYTVYALPVVTLSLADSDACLSETAITLAGGSPTGGTYNGTGVEGDGVTFNPSTATAGIHTITYSYSDANGCINTATDNFEVYALPSITFSLSDDEACVDESGFTLSGGLPAIGLYSGTGVAIDGLTFDPATAGVGTHTITYTITDPNGCISTLTDGVTVYALPVVTLPLTDGEACVDDVTLTLAGGNPSGGTYSGTNVSGTTFDVATAGVGTHSITYTYTNPTTNCTSSATTNIEVYALPTPTLTLGVDEACVSETSVALTGGSGIVANGSYIGTAVTGSGPYSFNPSVAGVGTHIITYTYTDGNGCLNTTTDDFEVFALPVVNILLGDDIACVDEATITLNGGTLSGGTFSGAHVSGTTFDIAAAGVGTHTITYTYTDANGCTNTATDDIIIYAIPTVASATPTHLATCGINDGTITATGTSGSGSYEYRINGGAWQSATVFSALSSGDYNVDIRNDNGTCFSSFTSNPVTINEPPGTTIAVSVSVTSSYTGEDITCFGHSDGTASAVAATGTAPYTYVWSNGQTGLNLVNVPAGTYFVTATDFTSCEAITSIEITQPDAISAGAVLTHVSCYGGSDGTIDLNVTGGVNAFTYGWDDLTTSAFYNFDNNTNDQTGNGHNRTGLQGSLNYSTDVVFGSSSFYFDGSTKLQFDDNSGFMESTFKELTVQMWIKPDDLTGQKMLFEEGGSRDGIAMRLLNDQLQVAVSRGYGITQGAPITFPNDGQWHHIGFVFDVGFVTIFLDGVMGGTVDVGYTEVLVGGYGAWNQSGLGGKFSTNSFGSVGDPFYEGLMDNYSYHRDALTANAIEDSFDDDGDREGLPAGDYDVLITDLNGCNTTITVTIAEPDELLLDTLPTEVNCYGGSDGTIDLTVTGGTAPFNYNWSNGDVIQDVSGLLIGVYSVTVTDDNGCMAITQTTIVQPDSLEVAASINSNYFGQALTCPGASDGAVLAAPTAGRPPYSYLWDTGATTAVVTGLSVNTYTVTITDDNGCTAVDNITISDPPTVTVSIVKDIAYGSGDVSCLNATDGVVTATGADGVAPFSYEWSDGQVTATATGLGIGTYTVTVTDRNLCTNTASVTLVNPTVIDPNISITSNYNGEDVSCPSAADGAVYVDPTGGGTYTYEWAHDSTLPFTTDSLTGLLATSYTVTVTDQFGCTAEASTTLQNPSAVTSSITNNSFFSGFEVSCNGGADGNITANAGGGVGSYTYQWARNGTGIAPTTANITSIGAETYTVTVSDANGCTSVSSVSLTEPTPITFSALSSPPSDCGESTGIILVSASGGTGSYQYSINGGAWQPFNVFFSLLTGTYDIRVRNQFGTCESTPISVIVEVADAPVINNVTIIHSSTAVSTDGGILVGASGNGLGAGLSLEYRLNGVTGWQSANLFENLSVGTYTIEVRYSGQTCITTQVVTLVAGQGVESSGATLSFCSGDASATQFVETYYIPGPEDDLLNTFQSIYDADASACGSSGGADPVNPISTYVSIGVVESGTIIYYDHWEDGYEVNLSFPTALPITQIWGDNDPSNGIPPGFSVDYLSAADIIILSNTVDVNDMVGTSPYLYNGGDIIGSRGNIAVTRLAWATGSGTLFAGALEVHPQETWGTNYTFPVGEDTDVNLMFSYTGAVVMAKEDGTVVNYVDNGTAQTTTLAKGGNLHINGGINAGDEVTASAPVQVHLLTGGVCQTFSSRFFTLKPTEQWASDYYNPVATLNTGAANTNNNNKPTYVHLYNPDPVNSITVSWESNAGGVNTVPVASNGTEFIQIPDGTGTHFYTTNGAIFYAIATIDSDPGINYAADWGFALLPGNQLTSQITMVGFAPGADPNTLGTNLENSSPIWITADYPSGSTSSGDITICIDHDGDGGAFIDGNGISYDEFFDLGELDLAKVYDPDDNDQTGTRIWVCDGSDAILAGAYGQDPATASGGLPGIDLGTGLPNGIPYSISKCANLSNDLNGNGLFDECDELIYTVMVRNTGALPLSTGSLTLIDTLDSALTYVNNSTIAIIGNSFTTLVDDDLPASAFPFDEVGYQHNATVLPGDSIQFQFAAVINDLPFATFVNNTAYAASNGESLTASVTFPVQTPVSSVLGFIPNDTLVTCGNVPAIPFQDTCQSIGLLSQYTWLLDDADSETSVAYAGEKAFDGSINSYWMTGSVGTTGCSNAYVSTIEDQSGVGNGNEVLGAPDGVGAELYQQSDQLTLDLGEVVAPGNTYTFTWRRGLATASSPTVFIYESSDGVNYFLRSDAPYSTSNTSYFTETFTAEHNVRYVRVVTQTGFDIDIDALAFESGCIPGAGAPLPHNLDIDLGAIRDISGFQYTPRQNNVEGRIEDYEFYISTGGVSWGAPIATGTCTGGSSAEVINFPPVMGRYVRFLAISAIDGNEYTAVAELDIFACLVNTSFAETSEQTSDGSCTDYDYDIYRIWTTVDFCGNVFVDSQRIEVQDILAPVLNDIPSDLTVGASVVPAPPLTDCSLQTNIAQGRSTTQSSTSSGGISDRAADGNTDGDFFNNSVNLTTSEFQPWWQVELDTVYEIDYVNLYNRTDCCSTRLSDFYVLVSSKPFSSDVLATNIANPNIHSFYFGGVVGMPTSIPINAIGRFVRVQLSETSEMNMAEFEVFPACISASDDCDPDPAISFVETISPVGCTYTITRNWTATDACGRTSEQTQIIDVSSTLSTLVEVTSDYNRRDISCVNGSDGEATVIINAGIAPLTYAWSGGQTTNVVTGLDDGTHYVTVTDGLGCQTIDSITLFDPPVLNANPTITSNYNGEHIRCFEGSDGTAFVSATGGTGTKTFLWSTGATTNALTGLVAGAYTVTATDANGCIDIESITLVEPTELALTMNLDSALACVGDSDGAISIFVLGGTGSYTYAWSNFNTSNRITSLPADMYLVTVTDQNGCTAIDSLDLDDPAPLTLSFDVSTDPSLCEGSDGEITISGAGGSGSFKYSQAPTGPWSNTTTYNGLPSGIYDFYVRNADGTCPTGPFTDTLVDPIPSTCPIFANSIPLILCNTDINIPFSISDVVGGTSYFWQVPFGMSIVSGQGTDSIVISADGVAVGTYDICMYTRSNCGDSELCCLSFDLITCNEICNNSTDDDGDGLVDCDDPDCGTIAEITLPGPTCVNESASFTALDGGSGATYAWNFGAGATPATATGLGPHSVTYSSCASKIITLDVTRGTCTASESESFIVSDTEAPTADALPAIGPIACYTDAPSAHIDSVKNVADNCSTVTVSIIGDSANPGCSGVVTRTYRLTDVCGNTTDLDQFISINDNVGPTFTAPSDTTLYLDNSCALDSTIASIGTVTDALDNCNAPLTISYFDNLANLSQCNSTGTFARIWTVTDACGNFITGMQTVSIQDNAVPSADPLPDLGPYDCYADIPAADTDDVLNETDNCTGAATVTYIGDSAPVIGCNSTVVRIYRLTDACGNTSDLTQNIIMDMSGVTVGGLTVDTTTICLSNALTGSIGATPDGNAVAPCNYTILYLLSTGASQTIIDTSSTPDFALTAVGDYAIHTLVYDTVSASVNYLDLSVLNFGVSQLSTVEILLEQGGGAICGALDMTAAAATATVCRAALGDFVWEDQNEDGIQTVGEPGIEGVTVTLYDNTNTLIATTNSAADGSYIFNAIPPGIYYMIFDVSTNVNGITAYKRTQRNIGSVLTDSDINSATERTHLFIFDPSLGDILTVDAGYILSCPPSQRGGVNVIRK